MEQRRSSTRNRGPPVRYTDPVTPDMELERLVSYTKNLKGRRCTFESPPFHKEMKKLAAIFVDTEFGNGYENEEKYANNVWYSYWDRFARSDCCRSPTIEDKCFVCKEDFDIEEGDLPKVCGVSGCPKVYHRNCWDYFQLYKHTSYFSEVYYNYVEADTKKAIVSIKEHIDSTAKYRYCTSVKLNQDCICPRHYCNQCRLMKYGNMSLCPTCPASYCSDCIGTSKEMSCRVCTTIPVVLDAPEMKC